MGRSKYIYRSSKYHPKYSKQLEDGKCKDGSSINKCCRDWGITPATYKNWTELYPRFENAAEMAALDRAIWWEELNRAVSSGEQEGNAGLIKNALANVDKIHWSDKAVYNIEQNEPIRIIEIITIPSKARVIEHQPQLIEHDEERKDSTNIVNRESDTVS